MKLLSVGTVITDNVNILLGHITGTSKYDIPKGEQNKDETFLETAQRELLEEFNIKFKDEFFEILGYFEYTKRKDLYLYKITLDCLYKDINFEDLICNSFVETKNIKEMDYYKIVKIDLIHNHCYPNMTKVLKNILIY